MYKSQQSNKEKDIEKVFSDVLSREHKNVPVVKKEVENDKF